MHQETGQTWQLCLLRFHHETSAGYTQHKTVVFALLWQHCNLNAAKPQAGAFCLTILQVSTLTPIITVTTGSHGVKLQGQN